MSIRSSSLCRGAVGDETIAIAGFLGLRRQQAIDARLDVVGPDAGQSVRESQHDRDEQRAEPEQPELRKRLRQTGLGKVDQERAVNRAKNRHAAADRGVITISIEGTM